MLLLLPKPGSNYAVEVRNLDFTYTSTYEKKTVLRDCTMTLERGSRCLLIGANGAGKSTLLRILGGKHLTTPDDAVKVLGKDSFRDLSLNMNRAYLDTQWGMVTVAFAGYGCPLTADIEVGTMMKKLQEEYPERTLTTLPADFFFPAPSLGVMRPALAFFLLFCRPRRAH